MRRHLLSLAIVISFVGLGHTEASAAGNNWKLGNVAKELVVETDQENDKQACGSTFGVFIIDIAYIDNYMKNNGNAMLDCWLDMQLPKTVVSKTTAGNFERYVKKAYLEILVDKTWVPAESTGFFDKNTTSWELNSLRINYFGPQDLVKKNCINYIEKSKYQTRAVVILNKQAKKLYSKSFTVSYINHPEAWLQTCPNGTSSNRNTTSSATQGKPACTGVEAYNLNIIYYNILFELRFAKGGYQAEVAKLRSQGDLIEDSCDIDSFDPVKMQQKSTLCTVQTKALLLEVQSKFNILNSQYSENLKSQKILIDKANFAGSSGKTNDQIKYQLQLEKLMQDLQWISSMRDNTIATFKALDSTCANSGISEPRI